MISETEVKYPLIIIRKTNIVWRLVQIVQLLEGEVGKYK
jgi:hypothetical protein